MKKNPKNLQENSRREIKTVLLMEEDPPLIKEVKRRLEVKGFNVWTAHSIEQALSYLDHELEGGEEIIVILLDKKQ